MGEGCGRASRGASSEPAAQDADAKSASTTPTGLTSPLVAELQPISARPAKPMRTPAVWRSVGDRCSSPHANSARKSGAEEPKTAATPAGRKWAPQIASAWLTTSMTRPTSAALPS